MSLYFLPDTNKLFNENLADMSDMHIAEGACTMSPKP